MSSSLIEWLAFAVACLLAFDSWRWERLGRPELERKARLAAATVAFFLGLRLFVVEPFHGVGPSMQPTLPEQSVLLVDKSAFGWRLPGLEGWLWRRAAPRPGEVVVARVAINGADELILKRVVAVGGDRVRVEGERVFVNDQPLEWGALEAPEATGAGGQAWEANVLGHVHRVWLKENVHRLSTEIVTWDVPEGHVFLVGDNRQASHDSRRFGPLPEHALLGRVFSVWRDGRFSGVDGGMRRE